MKVLGSFSDSKENRTLRKENKSLREQIAALTNTVQELKGDLMALRRDMLQAVHVGRTEYRSSLAPQDPPSGTGTLNTENPLEQGSSMFTSPLDMWEFDEMDQEPTEVKEQGSKGRRKMAPPSEADANAPPWFKAAMDSLTANVLRQFGEMVSVRLSVLESRLPPEKRFRPRWETRRLVRRPSVRKFPPSQPNPPVPPIPKSSLSPEEKKKRKNKGGKGDNATNGGGSAQGKASKGANGSVGPDPGVNAKKDRRKASKRNAGAPGATGSAASIPELGPFTYAAIARKAKKPSPSKPSRPQQPQPFQVASQGTRGDP